MILTVFRSRLRPDLQDYQVMAATMLALARQMPGFLSFKTFQHPDGERCSIVEFSDWESHNAWARHPEHVTARHRGRSDYYAEFSISAAPVERHYEFRHEEGGLPSVSSESLAGSGDAVVSRPARSIRLARESVRHSTTGRASTWDSLLNDPGIPGRRGS